MDETSRVREMSERLKEKQTKNVLLYEGQPFEFPISPADQIRFEENDKMAEEVYEVLIKMVDGEMNSSGDMDAMIDEIKQKLSVPQQEILNNIRKSISKGVGDQFTSRGKESPSLEEMRGSKKWKVLDYFYTGVKDLGISRDEIPEENIKLTPTGAVVVEVGDLNTWAKLQDEDVNSSRARDVKGFRKKVGFLSEQVDSSVAEDSYINEQFARTVYVLNDGNQTEEDVDGAVRHELFHDLYCNFIEHNEKTSYDNNSTETFFKNLKNELVAYLLQGKWTIDIEKYITRQDYIKSDGDVGKYYENNIIKSGIIRDLNMSVEEISKHGSPDINKSVKQFSQLISCEKLEKIEKEARHFVTGIDLLRGQIARLKFLGSKVFDQAIKSVLTAQSMRELVYKFSLIEKDKKVNTLDYVKKDDGTIDIRKAAELVYTTMGLSVPAQGLDDLIKELRSMIGSGDKRIEEIISFFKKHEDGYIKA